MSVATADGRVVIADKALSVWQAVVKFRLLIAAGGILFVAVALRFVGLDRVPLPFADEVLASVDFHYVMTAGQHFDGAHVGILARIIPALDGRLLASYFGGSIVDLRMIAACFGVLTVALMIPLGIELDDLALGLLSALALAIMPWDIYFSRAFLPTSEYLFLTVLTLVLSLRALRTASLAPAIGAAASAAASVYIYPVAIIGTPVLVGIVLVMSRRRARDFPFRNAAIALGCSTVLLLPYLIDHLFVSDASVGDANMVIGAKMLWGHGLDPLTMTREFINHWVSYVSPWFLLFTGDPNVRQSIQSMGSVGWVTGFIGMTAVVWGLYRRTQADKILLAFLICYPIADALTYYDAPANSLRGITGAFIWALWVAAGIRIWIRAASGWTRPALATILALAVSLQLAGFATVYFGAYAQQYAYAFETGYPRIYAELAKRGLTSVPITLHAGYQRDVMLQYFSGYRLRAKDKVLACNGLPNSVVHAALPRIFVIREDPDSRGAAGCIQDLISTDMAVLRQVSSGAAEANRKMEVISVFPSDATGRYLTAILYLHD